MANHTNVTIVDEATNNALHWRNIKSAATVTCRVSDWTRLPAVALTQVNSFTKTENKSDLMARATKYDGIQ